MSLSDEIFADIFSAIDRVEAASNGGKFNVSMLCNINVIGLS